MYIENWAFNWFRYNWNWIWSNIYTLNLFTKLPLGESRLWVESNCNNRLFRRFLYKSGVDLCVEEIKWLWKWKEKLIFRRFLCLFLIDFRSTTKTDLPKNLYWPDKNRLKVFYFILLPNIYARLQNNRLAIGGGLVRISINSFYLIAPWRDGVYQYVLFTIHSLCMYNYK